MRDPARQPGEMDPVRDSVLVAPGRDAALRRPQTNFENADFRWIVNGRRIAPSLPMNAAKITRDSKSNLALAFVALGRERRNDITIFYAFCRVIDDIADSAETTVDEKGSALKAWRTWIHESAHGEPSLAGDVRG